jgi:Fe2+ or Zn2+ uptake regulation protein
VDAEHERIARSLERCGQRYTSGRRRLVELLAAAKRPVTVRDLLARDDDLAASSTYRNLELLERCDIVRSIPSFGDDGVRYELHESLTGHHHHLGCAVCGQLVDLVLPDEIESALELAVAEARRVAGFVAEAHRLELIGTCRTCT